MRGSDLLTIGDLATRSGVAHSAIRFYESHGLLHSERTSADWARLSRVWRPRLNAQIERLERLRDQLDSCIGCDCLSLQRCALNNPADLAAEDGTDARYLVPRDE